LYWVGSCLSRQADFGQQRSFQKEESMATKEEAAAEEARLTSPQKELF
jgi:hypothetical protein